MHRHIQRNLDRGHRKDHVEIKKKEAEVPPPIVVAVVGPKGCGKSSLIRVSAAASLDSTLVSCAAAPLFVLVDDVLAVGGVAFGPQSLVKRYTRHKLKEIRGPVTVVTGKARRVTFFECPSDLNAMIVRPLRPSHTPLYPAVLDSHTKLSRRAGHWQDCRPRLADDRRQLWL